MRPQDLGIGKLFERIRDAVIVADAKTQRIILWNSAATNIFGYSVSEALELRVEALVPGHLKDQHRAGITRYAETGHGPYIDSPRLLELPALRKSGEEIYIELSLSPIALVGDADGNEHFALAIVRDITQRKRAEEEARRLNEELENRVAERTRQLEAAFARLEERERGLRESEERYRSFIQQTTEGIWRFELEEPVPTDLAPDEQVECFYRHGYLAECNDAMARIYGYARAEEIVGARLGDLLPPSIPENIEYLRAFVHSGYRLTDAESQEIDRHGNTKYFSNNLTGIVENESLLRVWGTQRDITERRWTEEALQISETRFRTMIEQSPLSIQILSPDGRTLQANRAWEELWGVTLDDIAGYNLLEDRQLVAKGIMPYIQRGFAGEPTEIPPIMYDPDETIPGLTSHEEPKRWVRAFIYPVTDEAGNVHEVILMHEDITERKQAEEVNARLAAIVESSDDAIIGKTLEGTITNWNRGAQNIYGYSAEEVVGKPINILVPPDRPNEIPKILERLRRGESIDHYETVRMTKDGRRLDISLTISPIKDSSGNIVGASTIARDITERKRAEKAIEQSELLYHTVVEQATENIFLVEAETRRIVESNPAFQRTLGYTEEELRSLTLYDIVAADRKSVDVNIQHVLEQRRWSVGERKYRRKDGSLVDVEVSASIILRNNRETMCVVAHDVTERKKNEEMQRFLAEAGASLSSSLDYRTTLARMAHLAVPYLADWCVIDVLEEDGSLNRLAVAHQDPKKVELVQELQERYPPDPDAPRGVGQALRTGRSELVSEIPESLLDETARNDEHREILRKLGLKSYMIVPLVARGRTLGAITLVSAESGRRYGQAELELTEELARRAALAVDNARLYRSRIQVVRTLQEGLLPSRLPEVPGVEVGLRYLSAGEVDVGGDFYDLFDTRMADHDDSSKPSSSWGVAIGDVSGKGAEAAAVLALARYTIRAIATRESHPSTVLTALNEAMLRQRREHDNYKFCTVAYAKLETNEGDIKHGAKVTVCRGGHSPPFLLKADGSIYKIGHPGHAIGVFDDTNLTEQEAHLAPGDALVLYTDGVVEARSPEGVFFGEERFASLLRSCVGFDAASVAGLIEKAVLEFQENDPRDDAAVLVLRVPE